MLAKLLDISQNKVLRSLYHLSNKENEWITNRAIKRKRNKHVFEYSRGNVKSKCSSWTRSEKWKENNVPLNFYSLIGNFCSYFDLICYFRYVFNYIGYIYYCHLQKRVSIEYLKNINKTNSKINFVDSKIKYSLKVKRKKYLSMIYL